MVGIGSHLFVIMYTGAKTVVRTVYGNSSGFEVKVGMHQGLALSLLLLHFVRVVDDAKCIVVTRVCLPYVCVSVCLSAAVRPQYCVYPDVTWGRGRGCPLVVRYWADLQLLHGLRCYGNITQTLVTSLRPSRDMVTWCKRSAGCACAAGR